MGSKPKIPKQQPPPPPPPPVIPPQISRKTEDTRQEVRAGSNRKALGSTYLQRRKATAQGGSGFGGQRTTLG